MGIPQSGGQLDVRVVPLTGSGKPRDLTSLLHGTVLAAQGPLVLLSDDTSNLTLYDAGTGTSTSVPVGLGTTFAPRGAFSPDGTQAVFLSRSGAGAPQLQILDLASKGLHPLALAAAAVGTPVAWTGQGVIVLAQTGVDVVDPASGQTTTEITAPKSPVNFELSADGSALAVTTHTSGLAGDTTDAAKQPSGNTLTLLRPHAQALRLRALGGHELRPLAVDRDGTILLYDDIAAGATPGPENGLYLVHPDGKLKQLGAYSAAVRPVRGLFTSGGDVVLLGESLAPGASPAGSASNGSSQPVPASLIRLGSTGKPALLDRIQTIGGVRVTFGGA
jgi:hypothetical protein